MIPLARWEPCLADMHRGLAFFDGITIEADRITDPRLDRVFPILEEEQVFMCRMMTPTLKEMLIEKPGARVLDIGTGSGVFSICAAKLGCRVVAIDISARAIRFARHNARINNICVSDGEPEPGQIRVQNSAYEEFEDSHGFDIVLLSPPYNPTCPNFRAPLYASAGPLGQDSFENQLPCAARLLRKNGLCIGNQMMMVERDTGYQSKPMLDRYFNGFDFEYVDIFSKSISVETFLRGAYSFFLSSASGSTPTREDVETYINRYSNGRFFRLVYYEIRPSKAKHNIVIRDGARFVEHTETARPNKDWASRIPVHQHTNENTSIYRSFPAPTLFFGVDTLPDFPAPEEDVRSPDVRWRTSVLGYLDLWLASSGLFRNSAADDRITQTTGAPCGSVHPKPRPGALDLLIVDTAPWYLAPEQRRELTQETGVWLLPQGHKSESARDLLTRYLEHVRCVQKENIGVFLHPFFTGLRAPQEWRSVQSTVHDFHGPDVNINGISAFEKGRPWQKIVIKLFTDLATCPRSDRGEFSKKIMNTLSRTRAGDVAHIFQSLQDLGLSDFNQADEAVKKRVNELRTLLESGVRTSGDILSTLENGAYTEDALYSIDLDICHEAVHRHLDHLLRPAGLLSSGWTTFIGLPIAISSRQQSSTDPSPRGPKPPENYRGGLWIYAAGKGEWLPEYESYLFDLARVLQNLYDEDYAHRAGKTLRRVGQHNIQDVFSHQIRETAAALSTRWLIRADEWTAVVAYQKRQGAHAIVSLQENAKVAPLPALYESVAKTLTVWAQTRRWQDLFLQLPATLHDVIILASDYAKHVGFVSVCRNANFAYDSESLSHAWATEQAMQTFASNIIIDDVCKKVCRAQEPVVNSDSEKYFSHLCVLLRLFIALCDNYIMRGDTRKPLSVSCDINDQAGYYTITFSNAKNSALQPHPTSNVVPGVKGERIIREMVESLDGTVLESSFESPEKRVDFCVPIRLPLSPVWRVSS